MKDTAATPKMSEEQHQPSGIIHSESAQSYRDDSDDEPMVYETPQDYATSARQERDRLIAEGADPDSVVLQSEVKNYVPRQDGDSSTDFVKRYVEIMNAMIGRGICILNDQCTADMVPTGFGPIDGRFFDLGPGSGATKREYREFSEWFSEASETVRIYEVPEMWLKFEKQHPREI
ncbi:hypothetical protein ANOM_005893 [Aspergillus nomiae NRRL 13137]|uniref:Uncharacterized protein n=1 Tax=Aspergillus nomiae NRRL (strain ATCC 15546 / NRRL 13137 / CBS 260.88 / M93) TaxID=1509407 RepID=A0A0L1J4Y0_ASPN3|nr:uncharacterized protein ANOM_005893 [Aspergillus nomiae NRRL 13137]KNG86740.1 hypothetical protein ANOM_005893 [Aspergillus nomiae NRRL 13137]